MLGTAAATWYMLNKNIIKNNTVILLVSFQSLRRWEASIFLPDKLGMGELPVVADGVEMGLI